MVTGPVPEVTPESVINPEVSAAERAVVADCIMRPGMIRSIAAVVSPDDFSQVKLGDLFGLIVGMVSASDDPTSVTAITVAAEAERRNAEFRESIRSGKSPFQGKGYLPGRAEIATLATTSVYGDTIRHAELVREAAANRSLAAFGMRVIQAATQAEDPAATAAWAVETAKAIRDGHRASTLELRTLAEIFADQTLEEYDWIIPGLLERGDRLIVTGGEGLGKSTFLRMLAMCAAAGLHPFRNERFQPRNVMVVDAENNYRTWRRKAHPVALAVARLAGIDPAPLIRVSCTGRKDITSSKQLAEIHAAIDQYQPDLMLIGPIYKLTPGGINNDNDAAPVITALDSIQERGITLLMEAHAGKGTSGQAGERDWRPRGSSALLGWPEFGFGLAPHPQLENVAQLLRWRGDRDERDWPENLTRGGLLPWTDNRHDPNTPVHGFRSYGRDGDV